ncbi:methionine--tRNA ligase [Mesohalobacter halotolerans]|uniref:Methionine--tRNA ligase n=1 Tax=Mesohalobacter halotolerans TaxID=1883405 RepID=A0A4U5TRL0_9FLAO|nr:methionine--tRNA ligase [Mesohalobacter halotolerans]MBS3737413.1 methionine--tRNA ligase [Psychroflexus sp.]TKS56899.1 methionine--tRNA ligase [Mesohalobacter halotolerans]
MDKPKRYTITAALPYTNGPIHIGHLAGVYVPADIYARYLRLQNKDVLFVCGSDEHGVPITIKAKKEGVSPQDVVDRYHNMIKSSFEEFGIAFDHYGRTTSKTHKDTASDFFKTLYNNNKFVEQTTEQLYDKEAQQFLADRFVTGTCPKCGHEEAYGDQCENCGTSLNATDLTSPKSAITGNIPTLKTTKHWFLPLDQYDEFLKEWIIKDHKQDWKPNVYGQCKSWIDEGLRPRAVTRDLDWGIPVPLNKADGKVLYVWFDAPIGYISATKDWAKQVGKNWEDYWKSEDTKLLHFIGKDNIVFHCIIFPCMLKAEGSFKLPDNVPANEFLNLEGQKLSTSKNWAVWLHEYLEDFPNQQDVLRYVLTANAPETKDNDFTWADFQARNNNELVAIYGNFINRVAVLTHKYYDGEVPNANNLLEIDNQTLKAVKAFPEKIGQSIEKYRFREAQQKLMELARLGNKYLADEEPWKHFKTDPVRTQNIMFVALQISAALAVLSEPFLPHTSKKLNHILSLGRLAEKLNWSNIAELEVLLPTNHTIEKADLLFSKIEDEQVQKQLDKLKQSKMDNENNTQDLTPQKEQITFEDFSKLDIRTGVITEAEKMPKTKKLMVLKVDIGLEKRTIVSGIAEYFKAEDIIGKQVSVVINLKPIKLRGTLSEGMILMTESKKGELVFVNPDENTPNGKTIA